ncbi:MAG: sialidase family protein [Candidatus Poseidoniia archaeon]
MPNFRSKLTLLKEITYLCYCHAGTNMRAKEILLSRSAGRFSMVQGLALLLVFLLLSSTILYYMLSDEEVMENDPEVITVDDPTVFVTNSSGMPVDEEPLEMDFIFSDVGETGKEPSIGITSSGCMFFIAMEKPMRSCDYGESWTNVADATQAPFTSDPYGWVDLETDRVFNIHMMGLESTWIGWSDNDGQSWLGNPHDSGTTPLNDHIKLATGPWVDEGLFGPIGQLNPTYDTAVYFCFNKLAGISCFTSFDGGATFEVGGNIVGLASTNGGLHGAITTAPDGTVYLTPRVETPTLIFSKDNGLNWEEREMGTDVGTPNPRKNSEVATDSDSNAYHIWTGNDQGIYMSRSIDSGESWDAQSIRISPIEVISTAFPQTDAGDPGRIAVTYLGSENGSLLDSNSTIPENWTGNAHNAPNEVHYHLYVTYSLNALDENPIFHTRRITDDPVQIGSICLNSGDCNSDQGGSNRNLLDFNDLTIDLEGRVYIGFADGCTDACASSPDPQPADSRTGRGSVYFMANGPSLYVENGEMTSPVESPPPEMNKEMQSVIDIEAVRQEQFEE